MPWPQYILTEGSDILNAENNDRLITEDTSGGGASGRALPTRPGRWQMQSVMQPVFVPAAAVQVILDLVVTNIPQLRRRALPTAILAGACFMPPSITPEAVSIDRWHPQIEVKAREPKDQSYITDSEFSSDLIPIVRVESWHPKIEEKAREPKDQSYITDSEFSSDLIPLVRVESWHPKIEEKAREPKDQSYITQQHYVHWSGLEGDYVGGWRPQQKNPVEREDRRYLYPSEFRVEVVVGGEIVTADKWFAEIVQPQRRKPSSIWAPSVMQVLLPETPTLDRWATETQQPTRRPKSIVLLPGTVWPLPPEIPTLDRWFSEIQQPLRRRPPTFLLPGTVQLLLPEVPTLDRWLPTLPEQIRRKLVTHSGEFRTEIALVTPTLALDWLPQYPDRLNRLRDLRYITQGDLILTPAQRPEVISVDKWFTEIVQPVRRRIHVPADSIILPVFIQAPEGPITLDKWFREIVQPKFLRPNYNYIFANGVAALTIVPSAGAGNDRLIIVDGRFAIKIGKRTYTFI